MENWHTIVPHFKAFHCCWQQSILIHAELNILRHFSNAMQIDSNFLPCSKENMPTKPQCAGLRISEQAEAAIYFMYCHIRDAAIAAMLIYSTICG